MRQITLFCLPYAGGSASIYHTWADRIADHVKLVNIELPGRGRRFNDAFSPNLEDAVNDILLQIAPHLNGAPIALFGHSMGGILAFELAYKLVTRLNTQPCHLFFAGCEPPHLRTDEKPIHDLPDDEFLKEVENMGGTPRSFFEQPELLELFLPILRNDFKIIEGYRYRPKPMLLDCDISVLYGRDEELQHIIGGWRKLTAQKCRIQPFEGDHFFINEHGAAIVNLVNETLGTYAKTSSGLTSFAQEES